MTMLIPFARRLTDQRMVDASSVKSGKACGCACPKCGENVIARHCTLKASHFAHAAKSTCKGALESSLHTAAKQVIMELGFVWLPESRAGKTTKLIFARAEVEKTRERIRPDLLLYTKGGKPLAVEVCVTHKIDEVKGAYLRSRKLACVEYYLDDVTRDLTYAELKRMFAEDEVLGRWAYNEKAELAETRLLEEAAKRLDQQAAREEATARLQQIELQAWLRSPHAVARQLPVDGAEGHGIVTPCPIRKRGSVEKFKGIAFADLDCRQCPFCTKWTAAVVSCIGHFPKLALKDDQTVRRFGGQGRLEPTGTILSRRQRTDRAPDPF